MVMLLRLNSIRLKLSVAIRNGQVNTFGGTIYFAVDGTETLYNYKPSKYILSN